MMGLNARALQTVAALAVVAVVMADVLVVASGRAVSFAAPDGTSLVGLLYEASNRPAPGVVLVHMLGRSKEEWHAVADRLQEAGATVLAFDLRGHGGSAGNGAMLTAMPTDVRAAVDWLAGRPGVRPGSIALVGASLGANLAGVVAGDVAIIAAVALISPSLDYRGIRLDAGVMKRIGNRPVWFAASTDDPYALRTIKELTSAGGVHEQRLIGARAHGTAMFTADQDLMAALVDWLRRRLVF